MPHTSPDVPVRERSAGPVVDWCRGRADSVVPVCGRLGQRSYWRRAHSAAGSGALHNARSLVPVFNAPGKCTTRWVAETSRPRPGLPSPHLTAMVGEGSNPRPWSRHPLAFWFSQPRGSAAEAPLRRLSMERPRERSVSSIDRPSAAQVVLLSAIGHHTESASGFARVLTRQPKEGGMTSHPPMQQHGKLPADPKRGASPLPSCEGHAGLPLAAGRRSTPRTQWCRLRRVQTAGAAVAVALVQRSALRLGCTVVTLRTRRERSPAPVASRGGRHGTRGTAQPRPGQGGVPTLGTASGQPSRWPRLWSRGAALLLALLFSGVLGYNQALNDLGVFTRTPAWCGQAGSAMPVAASGSEAPSKAQVTPTDGATTRGGTGLDPSPSTAPAAPWRSPSTLEMWASTAALVALCSAATLGRRRWPRPLGQRRGSRVTSPAPDALEPAEVAHGPQSPPTTAPISGLAARAQSQPEPPPGTPTAVNTVTPESAEAAQWLAHGSGESAEYIEWAPGHEAYPGQHGPAVARTPCDTGQFPLPVDSTVNRFGSAGSSVRG